MILNKTQAEAIYSAMTALSNLGNVYLFTVEYSTYGVRAPIGGEVTVKGGDDGFEIETFTDQNAFATAYGLE